MPLHHRPALANDRVQTNAAGQVVLKLKTAWRDGTTHLVMSLVGVNYPDRPATIILGAPAEVGGGLVVRVVFLSC